MQKPTTTSITITINSNVNINYISSIDSEEGSYRSGERGMSEQDILNKKSTVKAYRRMCR